MSRGRIALLATALTIGFGCGDTSSEANPTADSGVVMANDDSGTAVAASIELGAGLTAFRGLPAAGDSVELVAGPQGGWHIDLAVIVRGFEPENLTLTYSATTSARSFAEVAYEVVNGRKFQPSLDGFVRPGDRVVFDIGSPAEAIGENVTIAVRLTADSLNLTDHRQVTVVDNDP